MKISAFAFTEPSTARELSQTHQPALPQMLSYSANTLLDEYSCVLSESIERVIYRNVFIVDAYSRIKSTVQRLFNSIYLCKYIMERKIGLTGTFFSNIDEILARSDHFCLIENCFEDTWADINFNEKEKEAILQNIMSGGVHKVIVEAPGKNFIRIKSEPIQLEAEELTKLITTVFGLPKDYIIIKELIATEIVMNNITLDDIRKAIKREQDYFNKNNLEEESDFKCYMNKVSVKLFTTIFIAALNNLSSKLFKVLRDYEYLLREMWTHLKDTPQAAGIIELRERFDKIRERQDEHMYEKYPMAKQFDLGAQLSHMGPMIKPFQRVMDRLFARDKFSRKNPDQDTDPFLPTKRSNEVSQTIDLEYVKRLVHARKHKKNRGYSLSASENQVVSKGEEIKVADDFVSRKAALARELKEIVDFRTTVNSLQFCLEESSRNFNSKDRKVVSLVDAEVKGKNYTMKIRNLISRVRSGVEQPQSARGDSNLMKSHIAISLGDMADKKSNRSHSQLGSQSGNKNQRAFSVKSKTSGILNEGITTKRDGNTNDHTRVDTPQSSPRRINRQKLSTTGGSRSFQISTPAEVPIINLRLQSRGEGSTSARAGRGRAVIPLTSLHPPYAQSNPSRRSLLFSARDRSPPVNPYAKINH